MSLLPTEKSYKKRCREAASFATAGRGANCGTVAQVFENIAECDLISADAVNVRKLRYDQDKASRQWEAKYTSVIELPLLDGNHFDWHTSSPHQLFQYFLDSTPSFAHLLKKRRPGLPLQMLCYHDEVVPGNPLDPDPARRLTAFYVTFAEWGNSIHDELAWLPCAVLRTSVLKQVDGGLSSALRCLFKSWLSSFRGKVIYVDQQPLMLPISLAGTIMDESAMHGMWSVKGAAGRKPCLQCLNAVSKASGEVLAGTSNDFFLDISHCSISDFIPLRDRDAFEAVDELEAKHGTGTKKEFEELQKNLGFKYNPKGLLADAELRPLVRPAMACFDVLHCFHTGGIVACEISLFRAALIRCRLDPEILQRAVGIDFCSSRSTPSGRKKVLSPAYFGGINGWKANGSDQLNVLPLLHAWLLLEVCGKEIWKKMPMECSSLLLLMERLYALQMLCFTNEVNFCILLEDKQKEHFKAYLKAYNVRNVKPKHHYALHVPGQWRKMKTVLNTLTMERKHQSAKREVESSMQNLDHFECRLLRKLQCVQSTEISKKGPNYWLTELLDPAMLPDGTWTAKKLRRPSGLWKISTPILSPDLQYAGWIDNFVQIQNDIYISFKMFRSSKVIGLGVYEWKNSHENRLGTLSVSWRRPSFWKLVGNESLLTIW